MRSAISLGLAHCPIERGNIEKTLDAFDATVRLFARTHIATLSHDQRSWIVETARLMALDRAGIVRLDTNTSWAASPLHADIEELAGMFYDDAMKLKDGKP